MPCMFYRIQSWNDFAGYDNLTGKNKILSFCLSEDGPVHPFQELARKWFFCLWYLFYEMKFTTEFSPKMRVVWKEISKPNLCAHHTSRLWPVITKRCSLFATAHRSSHRLSWWCNKETCIFLEISTHQVTLGHKWKTSKEIYLSEK